MSKMATEVKEDEHVRLNKEDVGHLFTFYASGNVAKAAECWKQKSVSFKSPKSGRIFRQKKNAEKRASKIEEKAKDRFSLNRLSRLFEDLKKSKVSDFEYQQSKVRQDSSYKPFWATRVVQAFRKTERNSASSSAGTVESGNVINNKKIAFENQSESKNLTKIGEEEPIAVAKVVQTVERDVVAKAFSKDRIGSPKVFLTNNAKVIGSPKRVPAPAKDAKVKSPKRLSTVEYHKDYRLKTPSYYNGSKMFMPTGEQLFWVRS